MILLKFNTYKMNICPIIAHYMFVINYWKRLITFAAQHIDHTFGTEYLLRWEISATFKVLQHLQEDFHLQKWGLEFSSE